MMKTASAREIDLRDYHIFQADEMPVLETIFVETFEPTHPFGVKAVAEIPMDGVAPAIGNAVLDACGAQVNEIPMTPERVWRALEERDRIKEWLERTSSVMSIRIPIRLLLRSAMPGFSAERDSEDAIAARAGPTNPQTTWVLKRLGMEPPVLLTDASPRFESVTRRLDTAAPEDPLRDAWAI